MSNREFKKRTITDTIHLLCHAKGGAFIRAGKVNQTEVAKQAGTSQTNISRWFAGTSKPTDESINLLAKAFKVSPAQMRGELPINSIDGLSPASPDDSNFIQDFQSLPDELKEQVREQVKIYKKLNDQAKKAP